MNSATLGKNKLLNESFYKSHQIKINNNFFFFSPMNEVKIALGSGWSLILTTLKEIRRELR